MKTNRIYALAASHQRGGLFYSRLFIAALIAALLLALLPPASVLAAPKRPWENANLAKEWKNKLEQLKVEGLYYNQVRFLPADFKDPDDLASAWNLLHEHGAALRQANTVVFNHSGFDFEGNVTNDRLAYDSVHDLGEALRLMRVARMKIADAGYKIHRVR